MVFVVMVVLFLFLFLSLLLFSLLLYYPGQKKKNHPRDSRREEHCSTCDIMLDQARSAQGKSRGQSRIGLALRWSCLIKHDITRGTAFFSPRISKMVLVFVQGSIMLSLLVMSCYTEWMHAQFQYLTGDGRGMVMTDLTDFLVYDATVFYFCPFLRHVNLCRNYENPVSRCIKSGLWPYPNSAQPSTDRSGSHTGLCEWLLLRTISCYTWC